MRIPESHFFIDITARSGLQAQLREQIVAAILERRFAPQARLPASRRLADHLGIARVTVNLAYQALEADGYLASRTRSGVFVADDPPGLGMAFEGIEGPAAAKRPRMNGAARRASAEADPPPAPLGFDWPARLSAPEAPRRGVRKPPDWRSYPFPFVYGQVDDRLFPHNEWRDCARRALGKREFNDVAADMMTQDDPLLVAYTLSHGLPGRGVKARHEELLITLGAQNALWLAARVAAKALAGGAEPLGRKRPLRVAIEDPGYAELSGILHDALGQGAGPVEVLAIPIDGEGLDPARLPADLDLVCVSPSHHATTGATMPVARRRQLLALAEDRDFLIIEDDYDVEMRSARPPAPALKSEDAAGRVLYAGSYSKPLFPGLRLGYLVAPAPAIGAAKAIRSAVLRHPPGATQRAAAHFLALGHYNAHIQRLRRVFAERRKVAAEALSARGFEVLSPIAEGASSLWVRAADGVDSAALAERAAAKGVLIEAGDAFFADQRPTPHFRLAISSVASEKIEEGVRRLAECV